MSNSIRMSSLKASTAIPTVGPKVRIAIGKVEMLRREHFREITEMLTYFHAGLEAMPEEQYEGVSLTLGRDIVAIHEDVAGDLFESEYSVTCITLASITACSVKDVLGMMNDDECNFTDRLIEHMVNLFCKVDVQVLTQSAFSVAHSMTAYCLKKPRFGATVQNRGFAS